MANNDTAIGTQPAEIDWGADANGMVQDEVDIEQLANFHASQLQQPRSNDHYDISTEVTEIARRDHSNGLMQNDVDIEQLATLHTSQLQQPRPAVVAEHRPDSRYIQGRIWLGKCEICQNHENEGFLCASENGTAVCGHPFCRECANTIIATTKTCPKCGRIVDSFQPVHRP
ncbi:unnamed protein product [Adineta steineri]|uniref:RING-type domain-containing protein n=1 Tax=Adineta steineri TaxID=433720 RepID=A0A819AME9_9BILA|nr:unnamed protein product [Adineta steineri]CAF3782205.1 unnamed protein product [Adineta steineri]